MITIPTFISAGIPDTNASKNAIKGKITIWQKRPIIKDFGELKILLKSLIESESPRLNIINPITTGNTYVEKTAVSMIPDLEFYRIDTALYLTKLIDGEVF